jgi:hypothetical protein
MEICGAFYVATPKFTKKSSKYLLYFQTSATVLSVHKFRQRV